MLLTNVAQHHRSAPTAELHNMSKIVSLALERYSFKPNQRDLVRTELDEDFQFRGSDLLMTHVLFNLLKNGLRAIEARDGDDNFLSIELRRGSGIEHHRHHRHRRRHSAGYLELCVHSVRVGAAARASAPGSACHSAG